MTGSIGGASTISRSRGGGSSGGKYYRELVAETLYRVAKRGEGCAEVSKALVDVRIIHGCLAQLSVVPRSTATKILGLVHLLSQQTNAFDVLQNAGAIPKLVKCVEGNFRSGHAQSWEMALEGVAQLVRGEQGASGASRRGGFDSNPRSNHRQRSGRKERRWLDVDGHEWR